MAMTSMAGSGIDEAMLGQLKKSWGWLLGLGIFLVAAGTIGLGMAAFLTMFMMYYLGIMLLIGGATQLAQTFKAKGWKSIVWQLLIAVLYILAGFSVLGNPAGASAILTLMLAWTLIFVGIARIVMAFQHRDSSSWIWLLIGGIAAMLLGMIIISRWPVSGLRVIGFFIALEMIFNGWTCIFMALGAKAVAKAAFGGEAPPEPAPEQIEG